MYEASVPAVLETPLGNVTFNPTSGDGLYIDELVGTQELRAPRRNLPQSDGAYIARAFDGAYLLTARGYCRAEGGLTVRRTLLDGLIGKVSSLKRADGRFRYLPSNYGDERMLDDVRVADNVRVAGGYRKTFEFTVVSPYPYAIDKTQVSTAVTAGGTQTITNTGNAAVWPVLQVSASSAWTIENETTGQVLEWDGSIAALSYSGYAEVTMLRRTIYENGDGANLQGGVVRSTSTFWRLEPGANVIRATGADVTVLWNPAWA